MGLHFLIKPMGVRPLFFFAVFLIFSACVTEEKFQYLNKRIDAVETKTDKAMVSNNDRMATGSAEMDRLKEEMRFLNGRLDENSHLLKRTIERDTTEGDSLAGNVSGLMERMTRLELQVDRLSSYLGLEPMIKQDEKDTGAPPAAVPQIQQFSKPAALPKPEVEIPSDQKLYDINLAFYRGEKYEEAIVGFKNFLKIHPKSTLADNAAFWVGESFMALKQYEQAILAFQDVIKKYPGGNKVPNALLRQALAFYELKDKTSAKLLLKKLIKNYPKSSEAKIAQNKLNTIK